MAGRKGAEMEAERVWRGEILFPRTGDTKTIIYGLCILPSREVIYIGQTQNPQARHNTHKNNMLEDIGMFLIDIVERKDADRIEGEWIQAYHGAGARLRNIMKAPNGRPEKGTPEWLYARWGKDTNTPYSS